MLSGLKNLSLLSKIIFVLSLLLLFIWVIPNMVEYYKNLHQYELKEKELKTISMKYNIEKEAEPFDVEKFKNYAGGLFSKVEVTPQEEEKYQVNIKLNRNKIEAFNTFLETLSLRYLVKVDGALDFAKEDKDLDITLILKSF